jgi:hypothetical protein
MDILQNPPYHLDSRTKNKYYVRQEADMDEKKLTVRIPRDLVENAKLYAAQNNTTLTELIKSFLQRLPAQHPLENAPIVRRLSGSLSQNVTIQDYKDHLDSKYGQ